MGKAALNAQTAVNVATQYFANLGPLLSTCISLAGSKSHVDPEEKKRLIDQRVDLEKSQKTLAQERKAFEHQQAAAAVKDKKRQEDKKALNVEYAKLNATKQELAAREDELDERERQLVVKGNLVDKTLANVEAREQAVATKEKMRNSLKSLLVQLNEMDQNQDDVNMLQGEPEAEADQPPRRAPAKRKRAPPSSSASNRKAKKPAVRRPKA